MKTPEPKVTKLTPEQSEKLSEILKIKAYRKAQGELDRKHGYKTVVTPGWKKSLDHDSFSLILHVSVNKLAVEKPVEEKAPAKKAPVKKAEAEPEAKPKPEPAPEEKKA